MDLAPQEPVEPAEPQIEAPVSLLPDLTLLGIEEADKGICEDTFENRKQLRLNKYSWIPVFDSDGEQTNFIQAISPEMMSAKALVSIEDKKTLLQDPRDINSDYITGFDLILEDNARTMVPAWVLAATRKWLQVEEQREETGKFVRPSLKSAPQRCKYMKVDGNRCQYWTGGLLSDEGLCRNHLGRALNETNNLERARNRIRANALAATERLETLMDSATSEQVQLKAATEMLDRAGIRGGVEVDNNVNVAFVSAADLIEQRIKKLQEGAKNKAELMAAVPPPEAEPEPEPIEYAVVVEDDEDENANG